MLTLLDTRTSNLQSVANGFRRLNVEPQIAGSAEALDRASAIVLPGVGAFENAMSALSAAQLVEPLKARVLKDRVPLLGICLGEQLLADVSEENGTHQGLGLIPGKVTQLIADGPDARVPNFGWHDTDMVPGCKLFENIGQLGAFYYAHSFHFACADDSDRVATLEFGGRKITAAVARDTIFGVQFHPEKSQDCGLGVLENFLRVARDNGASL